MEYRNSGNATHHTKGMVFGCDSNVGVEIKGSTIISASDSAASGITLRAKGAGALVLGDSSNVVTLNGSTTPFKLVAGQSTTTIPNMPANSLNVSTMAAAGISTADLIITADARDVLSTGVTLSRAYSTKADEITLVWINPHASSIAAETTGITVRWAYIDRT